jgi:hypothetical protein
MRGRSGIYCWSAGKIQLEIPVEISHQSVIFACGKVAFPNQPHLHSVVFEVAFS